MRDRQSWLIGSNPDCDIVVDQPTVSGNHCRLTWEEGEFELEDLGSSNGTFVNGRRIHEVTQVHVADHITLGHRVTMPWPEVTLQRPAQILRIGRHPENDIVIEDNGVSGFHARLILEGDDYILEDLGSTNGTALHSPKNRIRREQVQPEQWVYFGPIPRQIRDLLHPAVAKTVAQQALTAEQLAESSGNRHDTPAHPQDLDDTSPRAPAVSSEDISSVLRSTFLQPPPQVKPPSVSTIEIPKESMVFGRDPSCDQVLDYPIISRRHACITRTGDTLTVEDLGSSNGTFVNGRRITHPVTVKPGDEISLGSYTFRISSRGMIEKRNYHGNISIEARKVCVEIGEKRLIEPVSLAIYPSEFVGLMGPSGSGKTTLMNALNGYSEPTYGQVLFNGQDLYGYYDLFSSHLGYVPQDDIIHPDLTVGEALYYTARLRLPSDFTDADIGERIQRVLEQLALQGTEDVLIGSPTRKGISGGQRKRVNLAMELLTDPSVLFLDEPTSGLSSEDALLVMKMLRELANSGKTILLTIHQPSLSAYRLLDNLVLLGKDVGSRRPGRLVYYGRAYPDAVQFFHPQGLPHLKPGEEPSPDEIFTGLAKAEPQTWSQWYQESPQYQEFVVQRLSRPPAANQPHQLSKPPSHPITQWLTLIRRCFTIKRKDVWNTLILVAQAPIIALLVVLVFANKASSEVKSLESFSEVSQAATTTTFLLVLSALWFGCSNAAREIVGEWTIFRRERMVNLNLFSYIASKIYVLGSICLFQCIVLFGIVYLGGCLRGPPLPMLIILYLTSMVGLTLGLLVSALSKSSEVAIALLPLLLLPMVILGGVMLPVHEMPSAGQVCAMAMPSRWAFEAMLLEEAQEREKIRVIERENPLEPENKLPAEIAVLSADYQPENYEIGVEDMAEPTFPIVDQDVRVGVLPAMLILGAMFLLTISAIFTVLKIRDIH